MSKTYHVYILANAKRVLYPGVTSDLPGRVWRHRNGKGGGFTARYKIKHLVSSEETSEIRSAIAREKQIKGLTRAKKLELIETFNPGFEDLSRMAGFFAEMRSRRE